MSRKDRKRVILVLQLQAAGLLTVEQAQLALLPILTRLGVVSD